MKLLVMPLLLLYTLPTLAQDLGADERALQLAQELEYLRAEAPKARVWGENRRLDLARQSGPAPTQMPAGIEKIEDRYFRDEVRFQDARAEALGEDSEYVEERESTDRVDGSVPKALRRKR